ISANGGSDYNGGNNGKLSDKSIDEVIDVVDRYQKNQTDKREIEEDLNHLEDSLVENKVNPSAVSRGSSLERSADGLLTLAGGKLT
ncbi:alpha-glycerophosphate oxidase, partial [Enterococcus faecalis]